MKIPSYLYFSSERVLPVFLQAEAAECGLACLAMIANYFGHDVNLNGLRQRFPFSSSGANIRNIMDVSNQLSFSTRPLRVDLELLPKVKLPAILHWQGNHFVVLKKITKRRAIIHDPALGRMDLSIAEVSRNFTGIAIEFTPATDFQPIEAKVSVKIRDLWTRIHGLSSAIAQIIFLSVAFQVVTFVLPLQLQLVIDESIGHSDMEILFVIAIGFFGLVSLHAIIEAIRGWILQLLAQQFVLQVIGNLTRHLLKISSSFFEKRHLGDILSRMQSTRVIQEIILRGLITAFIDGVMAIVTFAILFIYSAKLASIVVISFIFVYAINYFFYSGMNRKTEEQLAAAAKEQTFLMETIRATTTIKLLGREAEREATWRNMFVRSTNLQINISKLQILLTFLQNWIGNVQLILIIFFGANLILSSEGFSVGMLVAFLAYRQTFNDRANALIYQFNQMRLVKLHLDRLGDIISEPAEVFSNFLLDAEFKGGIDLIGVEFKYGIADPLIFSNVNINIRAGEFIAITGASGGGKSTLLKILLGLYQPTSGRIELDGLEARPELWKTWRKNVGVVAQDDKLLSGSIAENIAFFDPDMNLNKVIDAATLAQIHDDIIKKPMQYQTLIGDMGAALSAGQKQRLLLARALYRDPKILILDEGTANLDAANEEMIGDYIASLNITRIVVAHRPALIERANRVFKLDGGVLTEFQKNETSELHELSGKAA